MSNSKQKNPNSGMENRNGRGNGYESRLNKPFVNPMLKRDKSELKDGLEAIGNEYG